MQESNLPNEEGKPVFYPRMKLWNQVDLEYLANNINYASTFTPGDIMGLVRSLKGIPSRWTGWASSPLRWVCAKGKNAKPEKPKAGNGTR